MNEMLAQSAYFGTALTVIVFFLSSRLQKKTRLALLNPILISAVVIILLLLLGGIDYAAYASSAKYISYFLTPATVCLAIPLYEKLSVLKSNAKAILAGILSGVLTSLLSVTALALLLRLDHASYVTFLPKSVTTAIGMPLAEETGGYPAIAASVIILTGIFGNMSAKRFFQWIRVENPVAQGIAIGTASHAIGTARAIQMGEIQGAMSSLSIAVSGILTVILVNLFSGLL